MNSIRLDTLDAGRPDQYLAAVGLTWLIGGRLSFDGLTPVLHTDLEVDMIPGTAVEVMERELDRTTQKVEGKSERTPHVLTGAIKKALRGAAENERIVSAMRDEWQSDETPLSRYSAMPVRGSDAQSFTAHRLVMVTKDCNAGAVTRKPFAVSGSDRIAIPGNPKPTIEEVREFYRDEIGELLRGQTRDLTVTTQSMGCFSPGDMYSRVRTSGLKTVDTLVEALATCAMAVIPPRLHGEVQHPMLRWVLNTVPMTATGLEALQRQSGRMRGGEVWEVDLVSPSKGYRRFGAARRVL